MPKHGLRKTGGLTEGVVGKTDYMYINGQPEFYLDPNNHFKQKKMRNPEYGLKTMGSDYYPVPGYQNDHKTPSYWAYFTPEGQAEAIYTKAQ